MTRNLKDMQIGHMDWAITRLPDLFHQPGL